MRNLFCTVVLSWLLLAGPALQAQEIEILMTPGGHKDQVTAQSGEDWYGLFVEDGPVRLVHTTIQVTPFAWIDDKGGERTGRRVSCDKPGKPLFLVRGIEGLCEREILTEFYGKKFLLPGQEMRLWVGKNSISLVAFGCFQKNEPPVGPGLHDYSIDYQIPFQRRYQYHLLAEYQGKALAAEEELPNLIWAGDLDNDGRVDMFWDLSGRYYEHIYALFLSSQAKEGEAVAKVAELKISIGT